MRLVNYYIIIFLSPLEKLLVVLSTELLVVLKEAHLKISANKLGSRKRQSEEDNIIKNIRNLFKLKKKIKQLKRELLGI